MTDSAGDARRFALRLLGYKGRSVAEMRERLARRGFSEEVSGRTVDWLIETGLLDDRALAGSVRRQAVERKLLGHEAAKAFMRKRGLPAEIVESSLPYDEEEEIGNAKRLAQKRVRISGLDAASGPGRRKLWDFLSRRGYSPDVIKRAIREFDIEREA